MREVILYVAYFVPFWVGAVVAAIIFEPLAKAPRRQKSSTRIFICDLICLAWLVSLPLAWSVAAIRGAGEYTFTLTLVGFSLTAIAIYLWARCIIKLSGAGVNLSAKRIVFLAIVLPMAMLVAALLIPVLLLSSVFTGSPALVILDKFGWFAYAIFVVTPVVTALLGRCATRWVTSHRVLESSTNDQ